MVKSLRLLLYWLSAVTRNGNKAASLPYLINWVEIYAVVNRVFLVFAAVDGDSIEELEVQFYCLRIWVPGRTICLWSVFVLMSEVKSGEIGVALHRGDLGP